MEIITTTKSYNNLMPGASQVEQLELYSLALTFANKYQTRVEMIDIKKTLAYNKIELIMTTKSYNNLMPGASPSGAT